MRKKIAVIIICAAAALLLGGGYLLYGRFYGGADIDLKYRTFAGYEQRKTASDNGIVADYLWMRTKQLMLGKDGDILLIPSSYTIAGRLVSQEAESSEEYRLSDQALLLSMYVRNQDRASAVRLRDQILSRYDLENESNSGIAAFLSSYLEFCDSYGTPDDIDTVRQTVDILFDEEGNMRTERLSVAVYEQGGFYSTAEPQSGVYSTLERGTDAGGSEMTDIEGISISSVDLLLIRNLEDNGFIPEGSFDRNLELVTGAVISEDIPLFGYAYSDGSYIYSHDTAAAVDVAESVITMRHLAEVGELPGSSFAWLKNQVLNSGSLGAQYYYSTGRTEGDEAVDIYPDIMHIALETGDDDLYERMCRYEGSRVATYTSSPALSMIFREENGRFVFYARENLDVCLAVT